MTAEYEAWLTEMHRLAKEMAVYAECGLHWPPPCLFEGVTRFYVYELVAQHAERFRKVWDRYPVIVVEVYAGDLAAAARDTDEQVAEKVRKWGIAHRMKPTDWARIGRPWGWKPLP